jgi:hypothetical protein
MIRLDICNTIYIKNLTMSKTKYKTTSFAKFFFFMLIFLPIGYFALSMAKGQKMPVIVENIRTKLAVLKDGFKGNNDSDYQLQITKKDEEIQELREELFKCQNK